jgi:8-oxo-dGTP pyrophosphatase MutT (NUDIX family)
VTHDHEYVRVLSAREPAQKGVYVRPRSAATLILLDRSGGAPKVLMGRRNANVKFMPGKFVFPGGGIEPGDRLMPVAGALPAMVEARLLKARPRGTVSRARALALAAIRETFEETGILLGLKDYGAPENPPPGQWSDFAAHGVFPSLEGLHLIARAITPPGRIRRFDVAFFAVDAQEIAGTVEGIVGPDSELVELVWLPLAEAKELDLPLITLIVLRELEDRLAAGMGPFLPVPFYLERRGKWQRQLL